MSQLVRLEGKYSTQNAHCAMYKKNNLQEKVVESQNGAVVLDGGVAAIAITVFGKTVFFLGLNGHLKRP